MLILAVSDFHGKLSWLPAVLEQFSPDLLLSPGDWGDPGQVLEEQYSEILDRAPALSIYGNHDDRSLLEKLCNRDGSPVLLGQGEVRRTHGLVVAGISGIWAKTKLGSRLTPRWEAARRQNPSLTLEEWAAGKPLPPYITNEEVSSLAEAIARQPVDILLTHGCPGGLGDLTPAGGRGGNRCFREAFEKVRPRIHLCGHLHRLQRNDLPDGKTVLNCGSGAEGDGWLLHQEEDKWTAEPLTIQPFTPTPLP